MSVAGKGYSLEPKQTKYQQAKEMKGVKKTKTLPLTPKKLGKNTPLTPQQQQNLLQGLSNAMDIVEQDALNIAIPANDIATRLAQFQKGRLTSGFSAPPGFVPPIYPVTKSGRSVSGSSLAQVEHRARFINMIRNGQMPRKESFYAWMMNKADPRNDLDLRKPDGGFYICKLAKTLLSNSANRKRYWPIFANMLAVRIGSERHRTQGHLNIGRKDVTRALKIYDKLRSPSSEKGLHIPGGKEGKRDIINDMALAGAPLPQPRSKPKAPGKKSVGPFRGGYQYQKKRGRAKKAKKGKYADLPELV